MKRLVFLLAAGMSALLLSVARAENVTTEYSADVQDAIRTFNATDSAMTNWFAKASGYVVFPSVAKGAFIIGGAGGGGEVFDHGKLIGTATLSQLTVGFQAGGQLYSEVIFFDTPSALERFKESRFELSAQATAVAAAEGAAAHAKYRQGVAIFALPKGGLMLEASVGGQKFQYRPIR